MSEFSFCPKCATLLVQKKIGDEGMIPFCEPCKKPYFSRFPIKLVIAVVNERQEVALFKQKYVSENYPVLLSGQIRKGISLEESVLMEIEEEVGQKPLKIQYLESYCSGQEEYLTLGYLAYADSHELDLTQCINLSEWYDFRTAISRVMSDSVDEKHLRVTAYFVMSQLNMPIRQLFEVR